MATVPASRLPWIDHVRTFVILLVVNMHACVTYSHVGGWYFMSDHDPSLATKVPFILWQAHLQSFFMGLLFLVSGYFAHRSLGRRGPSAFVRERLVRLGLPSLFYMLVVHPFILLVLNPWHKDWGPWTQFYAHYVVSGRFIGSNGPLWFALALLVFCIVLATADRGHPHNVAEAAPPSGKTIALFAILLGVATFLTRLVQPIGTNILNFQLCFFPQYIAFFCVGVIAARGDWLVRLAESSTARRAGWIALIGGPIVLLTVMMLGIKDGTDAFNGGWHWQAFGLAMWEQCTGVSLSLGVVAWFARHLNVETRPLRWLADRSFAVYVLHAPVLVALTLLFWNRWQNPYGMTLLVTVLGLAASYLIADLARRTPGLRAIL